MNSVFRTRLTFSALAAASSIIAISAPAHAQSVCTATTATTFDCTNGSATGTITSAGTTFTVVGSGLSLGSTTGAVTTTAGGSIASDAVNQALFVDALGNVTITAAGASPVNVSNTGLGNAAVLQSGTGAITANLGTLNSAGASALLATGAGNTNLTTGSLTGLGTTSSVSSTTGNSSLTVNGDVTGGLVSGGTLGTGATTLSSTGTAVTQVNGNVSVSAPGQAVSGITTEGAVSARTAVTGTTTVTGASGAALTAVSSGGLATVNCGNVLATGGAMGINAIGSSVRIRCGNVTTSGASATGATGVLAVSTGATGTVDAVVGTVSTAGANSTGVRVESLGDIALTTGLVTTTGAGSVGVSTAVTGAGNTVLNIAGVQSTGNGIEASTTGAGNINITTTAPVTSTGGYGIVATGTTGTLTVIADGATGALGGIRAINSGAGTVNVTTTDGATTSSGGTALYVETLGTANTTVGAGSRVQGREGFTAVDTRGTLANNVTVGGILNRTSNGTGLVLNAVGGAATVTVLGTGSVNGPISLTANNDTVNNSGSFTFAGTSDFGAGTDVFNNTGTGTLTLTGGAVVNGLETLNNAGTTSVTGTATLNGTTFNNTGQLSATGGAATIGGLATFNNTGLITMVDGAANDTLTIGGNYTGSGNARLAVDVDGSINASDRLVVTGNISGSTVVDLNLLGAPLFNPTGVVIVDGQGTVSSGAFTLAPADAQFGFLNLSLAQSGNDTRLVTNLDSSVTELALLGSMGQELWYQSFDAYSDAVRGRHAGALTSGHTIGLWGQLYASKDRYGDSGRTTSINGSPVTFSDNIKTHRRGAQVGIEFRGAGFVIGATGGYEKANNEESSTLLRAEGHNYGAYALFGMANGFYAGALYKRDEYNVRFGNPVRGVAFRNEAKSEGVDGEIGFKGGMGGAIMLDVNAGLSYVTTDIDPFSDYGLTFDWDQAKSLRGRAGARLIFPQALGAFVGAKVFHEFKDDGYLAIRGTGANPNVADIAMPHRGTWVRLEGGLDGTGTHGAVFTLWGDLGETKSFGGRVGFRF